MAFIHECSCECTKSELDLFSVPPTQTSVEAASYCDYHPMTSMNDDAPIEFEIGGTGDDYIDLGNTYLFVRVKITKANGDDLEANDAVAPTNYFLHSLFSQVDISLNGTQVTTSTNTYAYRSMIEAMLSYGGDAKQSQLTSGLFYKDDAGRMDAVLLEGAINEGFMRRRALIARSRVVDLMGRIHADIFFQDRYMLNEVNIKIKLTRSKDAFCLIAGERFAVRIVAAELIVRKVKLSPSVFLAHAKALEHGTAKYPIKRVVCKTFTIPAGFLDVSHEKLFSGQLPSRLVIGIVDNEAFNGTFGRNPFNFNNYNLSEICVYLDGQQAHGIKTLKPDYEHHQYIDAYMSLFIGSNKVNRDEGNFITRTDYPNGYALYAYDLTPDLAENDHFNLSKQGNVRLLLKFAAALTRAVTVVAYAEFENIIEIDRSRNVIYDFSS
jgi:hypothetical protein